MFFFGLFSIVLNPKSLFTFSRSPLGSKNFDIFDCQPDFINSIFVMIASGWIGARVLASSSWLVANLKCFLYIILYSSNEYIWWTLDKASGFDFSSFNFPSKHLRKKACSTQRNLYCQNSWLCKASDMLFSFDAALHFQVKYRAA